MSEKRILYLQFLFISLLILPHGPALAQEDTWTSVAPMPTARESLAACAVDGKIYVFGGFQGSADFAIDTHERYDALTNSWSTMPPMPTAREEPEAAVVDGKCYLIGGRVANLINSARSLDVVEVYDPTTNSWSTRAPMLSPRYAHSVAVVDGKIYVMGGTPDQALVSQSMEVYDPATDTWTELAPMTTRRALHAATAARGKIYVMGGTTDGEFTRYASMEIYDPATDTWSDGPAMPMGKFSLTAETANGRIYAIGGADGAFGALKNVMAFDLNTRTWSTVSNMNVHRVRFDSATVNNQIYVFGGAINFGSPHEGMDAVERYTPATASEGFSINEGISDAWFNSATAGQGFFITVFPQIRQLFLAWFTYDAERPPVDVTAILGEPGQRWFTAQGPYEGDTAQLTLFLTAGGIFDTGQPAAVTDPGGVGTMTIEFADCTQGILTYQFTSGEYSGTIPIQRIVPDNVELCEALANK
jgi:N-acetylneuraminic acid mutarotase